MIAETVSGSTVAMERKGFRSLMDKLDWEDILVVTKLDRLGRNAMDVRATVERLAEMQVKVYCLALGGADLTSAAGKMTMAVIAAVAEFETRPPDRAHASRAGPRQGRRQTAGASKQSYARTT